MAIIWHFDNLKISHHNGWEVTNIIKWLGKIYSDIKVKQGKKHHYLGMDLDFKKKKMVKVLMVLYVKEITNNFPEVVGTSTAATPVENIHFKQGMQEMQN